MTKKLYIDMLSPDKSIGMAMTPATVSYNLIILDRFNDHSSPIFSAGKYVCLIMATPQNKGSMFFLDFKSNPENFKMFAESPDLNAEMRVKFKSLVEAVNADYDKNKNAVELIIGTAPTHA